ncbi:hypothetical protein IPJ72_07370 [Candidatus Peregrinibacteria bacterium]|nr:MAG: hypothetical protein IPJ72_07370 [Candidatus Peregrinibacteria bacterium]
MNQQKSFGRHLMDIAQAFALSPIEFRVAVMEALKPLTKFFPRSKKGKFPTLVIESYEITHCRGALQAVFSVKLDRKNALPFAIALSADTGLSQLDQSSIRIQLNQGEVEETKSILVNMCQDIRLKISNIFEHVKPPTFKNGASKELAAHFCTQAGLIEALVIKAVQAHLPADGSEPVHLSYRLLEAESAQSAPDRCAELTVTMGGQNYPFRLSTPRLVPSALQRARLTPVDEKDKSPFEISLPSIVPKREAEVPATETYWGQHEQLGDAAKTLKIKPLNLLVAALWQAEVLPAIQCRLESTIVQQSKAEGDEDGEEDGAPIELTLIFKTDPAIIVVCSYDRSADHLTILG